MIGDRRRKERASSPTLIFFEREILCKLSKNLREFCVLFCGGCQTSKSKKKIIEVQNNARPPCRWCRKFVRAILHSHRETHHSHHHHQHHQTDEMNSMSSMGSQSNKDRSKTTSSETVTRLFQKSLRDLITGTFS